MIIGSAIALITACNSSDYSEEGSVATGTQAQIKQEQIKQNYVAMAYAAYSDSLTTAQTLQTAVNTFISTPTEVNLDAAKAAYKDARIPYQQAEIMRWDSSITLSQDLSADGGLASVDEWEGQVNAWPLDESHIDSLIQGSATINTELLLAQNGANDSEANVTTGVHAVEYLLWGRDTHGTSAGAGERPASDYDVVGCLDTYCQRRAQYLSTVTNLLVTDLTNMKAEWSVSAATTAGSLAYNFLNSEFALDYIIGSIHAMATDELAGARMNSGLFLGDPEEEHDCFSDLSHVAIYYNFQGVKNAFYGNYGTIVGVGIGDLIKDLDADTYNEIDNALVSIEGHMSNILAFGERTENTIRFDQIIGQSSSSTERMIAESAVTELIALDVKFRTAAQLLSLDPIDIGGGGDSN